MSQTPLKQHNSPQSTAGGLPAVELVGITKRFPGVVANDDVNLAIHRGEVHCLLGENGAGKSTLMSILSGMLTPDDGRILINGDPTEIDSPRRALDLGIGMVYQHSSLVPALTVLENLMLGDRHNLRLDASGARRRLAEFAETLGVRIPPYSMVASLALGQQQQVEIVKALWRGSSVLILDEPTSMLTPQGVADLQRVLLRLKGEGLAIVFITHKLHEALAIGDRVSILRRGRMVGTLTEEILRIHTPEELQTHIVDIMFGEEAAALAPVVVGHETTQAPVVAHTVTSDTVLDLDGVSTGGEDRQGGVHDVTLSIMRGEVLGIAGVDGNGQHELAEAIAGQRPLSSGAIQLESRSIGKLSVFRRQQLGLRYVTDDRLGEGIVPSLSVALNLMLKRIGQGPFWKRGVIQQRALNDVASDLIRRFDVRTPSTGTRAGTLSGGNIQKVLLARELSFEPKVVVYNKPTQGLDVKTTQAVRQQIREGRQNGVTAIVISTDLDELLDISDRIAVLYRGQIVGIVENTPDAAERIGELMLGGRAA
ncbi:MAG: putative B6 ABC transporter ATP-binding protein [Chloroflexota bacterium]